MPDPVPRDAADIAEAFSATAAPVTSIDDAAATLTALNIARARCGRLTDELPATRSNVHLVLVAAVAHLNAAHGYVVAALRELAADA